jgi:hypothetical protein
VLAISRWSSSARSYVRGTGGRAATNKNTVNAALESVAGRRRRIEELLDDPYALGVGPDITDAEIMRDARR